MSSLFNTLSGLGAPSSALTDSPSNSVDATGPRSDPYAASKSGAHQNLQDPCDGYPAWLRANGI